MKRKMVKRGPHYIYTADEQSKVVFDFGSWWHYLSIPSRRAVLRALKLSQLYSMMPYKNLPKKVKALIRAYCDKLIKRLGLEHVVTWRTK